MVQKVTYFISDLHLGAHYLPHPASEQRAVRFLKSIKATASELYLLGDILDYWFEYRNVVPQGHVRFFGALAELADSGVGITWVTGNHDVWLRTYLRDEIGIRVLHKSDTVQISGHKFFISHGDDVGERPLGYRLMRGIFYNPVCQWLYAGVHPRWTTAMANGISTHNRTSRWTKTSGAKELARPMSDPLTLDAAREPGPAQRRLTSWANEHSALHPDVEYYVTGHLHVARTITLETGKTLTVLGDWISRFTYATFNGNEVTLHQFKDDKTTEAL